MLNKIPKNNSTIILTDKRWNTFWTNKIVTVKYDEYFSSSYIKLYHPEIGTSTAAFDLFTKLSWRYVDTPNKKGYLPEWF